MNEEVKTSAIAEESRKEDKKHVVPFIIIMVLCVMAGAVIGFAGFMLADGKAENLYEKLGDLYITAAVVGRWVFAVFSAVYIICQIRSYINCKKSYKSINIDDEKEAEAFEKKLNKGMLISNAGFMGMILFGGISFYYIPESVEKGSGISYILAFVCYFVIIISVTWFQNRIFNMVKCLYPEKAVSTYDIKFKKKFIDSCDEAEKFSIYKASYRSYNIMNGKVFPSVTMGLMLGGMIFEIGMLPFIVSALLWIISQAAYLTSEENKM